MSLLTKLFGGSYEDLWKAVIRPQRDEYKDEELGAEKFTIKDKFYKRTDLTIKNKRNHKLACSFWEPYDEEREFERLPCVVYLHGNSSSRCEAVSELKYLLPMNITVFAFDFSGCGRSEGDYISLGWYERDDVECVIEYLRKTNKVSTIGLWGRSMGAVTAIMYGDRDPSIAGLVLDSAFASLKVLIEELVKERVNLPTFILNQAVKLVKSTVMKKAKFNLDDIEPIKYARTCFIPAQFCHGKNDNFVKVHHCQELYDVYPGDKNVRYEDGDHNTSRSKFFRDSTSIFFYNTLQCAFMKEISDNYDGFKFSVKSDSNVNNNNENNNNEDNDDIPPGVANDEDLNEEEMFQKILEISKKEYEQCMNKEENKKEENNLIDNNNNVNSLENEILNNNNKQYENSDLIIFPPPLENDKVKNINIDLDDKNLNNNGNSNNKNLIGSDFTSDNTNLNDNKLNENGEKNLNNNS